jgi:hypothetical protein
MALVLKDRVKETSVSTGTGAIALDGATGAYQAFSTIGNGNTTYYAIAGQTTNEWEVGIGTYNSGTDSISRDVILSSSNSNTIVTFSAGTKDVFITYPSEKGVWLDASDDSNSAATIGTTPVRLGATALTLAGLTSVTVTQDPSVALDLATKQYVDTLVSSGITYHAPVKYEVPDTTGNLTATYNNGTAGVGATLTNAGTQVAFTPDGIVASVNDRILVYNQTNATQNGVYTVTTVGSGATNWVLTRATDADSYGLKDPDALGNGDAFFVSSGNTGAGETYVCNTVGVITFGTTAITFQQISASQVYNAGTGLTLSPATTFNIANTAVTPASYGAASKTLTASVNAQGQLTALADTNIDISMSQVTSGTLGATQGGTGQSSYSIGDILYADTTTSLARLADVATGNALISGGLNAAPSWGKIALASAVSGTLPIANGGTNSTATPTAGGVAYGTGTAYAVNTAGTSGQYLTSGGAGAPTWTTLPTNVASISFGSTGLTPSTATTGAVTVAGTLAVANGGTGNTTAQAAMNTLAGATTSGQYLRGNGTNVVMASIVAGDVPTLNQNTTGNAATATTATNLSGGTVAATTINGTTLSTTGNTILGDATTDTLNVAAGTLVTDGLGKVGIGTASPGQKLQVVGTGLFGGTGTDGAIQLARSSDGAAAASLAFLSASTEVKLNNAVSGPMTFFTNNTERMRLDSSGQLGVGMTTSYGKVSIANTAASGGLHLSNGTTDTGGYLNSTGTSELMVSGGASYNSYSAPNFVMNAKSTVASGIYFASGATSFWNNTGLTAGTTFNQTERMRITSAGLVNIAGLTASSAVATDASKNLVSVTNTGSGNNVLATSPTLVTPALGTPSSGTLSNCTVDGTNEVGFKNIPQNSQSAAYTLVLADSGKHIYHPSADTTARTWTIPANGSVAFPIGTAVTFVNDTSGGVITIAITTDTLVLSPAGTTGSRSLAANGIATAIKVTSTRWIISGSGLT